MESPTATSAAATHALLTYLVPAFLGFNFVNPAATYSAVSAYSVKIKTF